MSNMENTGDIVFVKGERVLKAISYGRGDDGGEILRFKECKVLEVSATGHIKIGYGFLNLNKEWVFKTVLRRISKLTTK